MIEFPLLDAGGTGIALFATFQIVIHGLTPAPDPDRYPRWNVWAEGQRRGWPVAWWVGVIMMLLGGLLTLLFNIPSRISSRTSQDWYGFLLFWGTGMAVVGGVNWLIDKKRPLDADRYVWVEADLKWRQRVTPLMFWIGLVSVAVGGIGRIA